MVAAAMLVFTESNTVVLCIGTGDRRMVSYV